MNEWAARIMSVFPERGNKADLDQFIQEVSNDDLERMYFQKEFNEEAECRPTFEQVSQDRIIDEANKNIIVLKSLEAILNERMQGFNSFSSSVTKTRPHFEQFEHSDCTLKLALDSLFIYVEQEILQSKQNIFLGDLRRSLNEMRTDAQKRITDYQKEIAAAEKDVITAEKKLSKSKEQYDRSVEFKAKMESFELDILMNASRLKKNSFVGGGASGKTPGKEVEDSVAKYDREIKEDIRNLLRVIGNRDQVLSASRRAFQKLDKECKKAIYFTLRKVAEKEKESALLHLEVAMKMEGTVCSVDVDRDVDEFIQLNIAYENGGYGSGALELSSQALSLLGDLIPSSTDSASSVCSGKSSSSESSTPRGSFSGAPSNTVVSPARSKSISGSTASSGSGSTNVHQFQTPTSKLFSLDSAIANKPVLTASSEELGGYLAQIFYAGDRQSDKRDETAEGDPNTLSSAVSSVDISQPDQPTGLAEQQHQHLFTQRQLSEEKRQDEEQDQHQGPAKTRMSSEYMNYKRKSLHSLGAATTDPPRSMSPTPVSSSSHHHQSVKPTTSVESNASSDAPQSDNKAEHRRTRVMHNDVQYVVRTHDSPVSEWLASNPPAALVKAVDWIGRAVKSQGGRDLFIAELNQFRSRKVDVGSGFDALGAVLWTALSYCQSENDIHTAKVMMMLSQTFYRQIEPVAPSPEDTSSVPPTSSTAPVVYELESLSDVARREADEEEDEDASIAKRGVAHRQYIKEKLTTHPIWQDGNYWEQALWQCAIEQLQTIPYEKAWYDMDRETRAMSVRRVHDVIFSQVMAITHSMLELGCSSEQSREFLYRMCVIHQLGESQRQQLLGHVLRNKT